METDGEVEIAGRREVEIDAESEAGIGVGTVVEIGVEIPVESEGDAQEALVTLGPADAHRAKHRQPVMFSHCIYGVVS